MVRLKFSIELTYGVLDATCDFLFNIHPAITASQQVLSESLSFNQPVQQQLFMQNDDGTRWLKVRANSGELWFATRGWWRFTTR